MKFGVIGAGSWGTTLADLLCRNGHRVILWAREPEVIAGIRESRRNPFFAAELDISPDLLVTPYLPEAVSGMEAILLAVPSPHVRAISGQINPHLSLDARIINVAKGLEPVTGKCLSEVLLESLFDGNPDANARITVLSGPNLATEVAARKTGATVIASLDEGWGKRLQTAFSTRTFRVYRHTDRLGVELGGTLKNVFAIGAGIVDGLGLGDNSKAAYLTRAIHEMVRLGVRLGGRPATFYGLSGLGDLMATSASPLSRNHRYGQALAQNTLEKIFSQSRMVVEGVETARMARDWGKKLSIPLPITEEICRVLFEDKPPGEAARDLMTRSLKDEEE